MQYIYSIILFQSCEDSATTTNIVLVENLINSDVTKEVNVCRNHENMIDNRLFLHLWLIDLTLETCFGIDLYDFESRIQRICQLAGIKIVG